MKIASTVLSVMLMVEEKIREAMILRTNIEKIIAKTLPHVIERFESSKKPIGTLPVTIRTVPTTMINREIKTEKTNFFNGVAPESFSGMFLERSRK